MDASVQMGQALRQRQLQWRRDWLGRPAAPTRQTRGVHPAASNTPPLDLQRGRKGGIETERDKEREGERGRWAERERETSIM